MAITSKVWNGSGYTIILDSNPTSVVGSDGNDSITGVGGTVLGGLGNDIITLTGFGSVSGGDGADTIKLGSGTVEGGTGNDTITVTGWSAITGGDGDDWIKMQGGQIDGGLGNDTISASGSASIWGGAGNDIITMTDGTVDAGAGNNTITTSGWTTVLTSDGADTITLQGGRVTSGGGNDKITIGSGGATVDSGLGNDTVTASGWSTIQTGDGADVINIAAGTIDSGAGDDVVTATAWSSIATGDGNDTVSVTTGSINTGAGNDKITVTPQAGTTGWTQVAAGDGDDAITITGSGAIDGGAGNDTVNIVLTGAAGTVNTLSLGSYHVNSASSINDIKGALSYAGGQFVYNDTSTGQYLSMNGIENVNVATGSNASDLVIDYGSTGGSSNYDGGGGSDAFYADWSSYTTAIIWNGSSGNTNTIATNFERYLLQTGSGNDLVDLTSIPSMGNDEIYTNAGNDTINGGLGADTMSGGDGSDVYYIESPGDVVIEPNANSVTGGVDTVYSSLASYTLTSNIENGIINNVTAANITGNSLNNILWAGNGNNIIDGGAGNDTASYELANSAITIDLGIIILQTTGGSGYDALLNIENLTGSNYSDKLIGNSGINVISSGKGDDTLNGGSGADTLIGGDGSDYYYIDNTGDIVIETTNGGSDHAFSYITNYTLTANVENGEIKISTLANLTGNDLNNVLYAGGGDNILDGGAGFDTANYFRAASAINIDLKLTNSQNTSGSGIDTLINIEGLIGSSFDDKLAGNSSNNVLNGGIGNDTLTGGNGNDQYFIDSANDQVIELTGGGRDIVCSSLGSYTLAANIEDGDFTSDSNANLIGNELNNTLYSNTGNNVIDGSTGTDTVSYAHTKTGVSVNLATTKIQNTVGAGYDVLLNIENIIGSSFNDSLIGSSGDNLLNGDSGNDTLTGGTGFDTLTGGAGNDTFVFSNLTDFGSATGSCDAITDFTSGQDRIDLSAIDASSDLAGDQAFKLVSSFSTAGAEIRYSSGALYFNIDHDVDAEYIIQFTGSVPSTLTATAFLL